MDNLNFHARAIIVFSISIAITLFSLYFIGDAQRVRSIEQFEISAQRHTRLLQSMIDKDIDAIESTAIFFQATDPHEWYHFAEFTQYVVGKTDALIAVEWMQKVESNRAESHIEKVRRTFPNAVLYTSNTQRERVYGTDLNRQSLFVATDIYPRNAQNEGVIGFYPTRERFDKVLESIQQTRLPSLSDKLTLLQDEEQAQATRDGFLLYYPVFERNSEELKGVIIGVLRASVYFDTLVSQTFADNSVALQIIDAGHSASDNPVLYQSTSWDSPVYFEHANSIHFSNRSWIFNYRFQRARDTSDKVSLFFVAIAGIIASFFIAAMVNESITKQEILERELQKRTKELNYLASHDAQTGTLNRRAFNQIYKKLIGEKRQFSLVTFDIDKFKSINDHFGHPVGDAALSHIANIVLAQLEDNDKLFRIGGDEFYIVSEKHNANELFTYIDKIRKQVASTPLKRREEIYLTISMGAAIWNCDDPEHFPHHVDAELYRSKASGRNRVSIYHYSPLSTYSG